MTLTVRLKKWLRTECGVKRAATAEEYRTALNKALASGKLTGKRLAVLTNDPAAAEAVSLKKALLDMKKMLAGMGSGTKATPTKRSGKGKGSGCSTPMAGGKKPPKKKPPKATAPAGKGSKGVAPAGRKGSTAKPGTKAPWVNRIKGLMGRNAPEYSDDGNIRVKGAWERYDTKTTTLLYGSETKNGRPHPFAGRPVRDFSEHGRTINEPSELDKAVSGAFAKFLCATAQRGNSKTFGLQALPEHDRELLYYALDRMNWGGASDGGDFADIKNRRLTPKEQKALIDDGTSGGIEAAPIVFDDQIIQTPLLYGELFPLVNVVPLDRGRRVEGVQVATVTSSWGGVDDSAITLFNTSNYVSAFDTTVFRWEGSIRIGLDFLSDTPIDFGAVVTQQYGERLLEDLDDCIATGNGSTQPEGIINKSGATSVNFGGTTTIGSYEQLRFGVVKAEHKGIAKATAVFCGTETSYQRVRSLPVGASDARRLYGTGTVGGTNGLDDYQIHDRPYKINESLTNQQVFYAILARYRMYRRRGLVMRTSTEGDTLIRNNEMLMVAMARYGGQMERGACVAKTTTAEA